MPLIWENRGSVWVVEVTVDTYFVKGPPPASLTAGNV